MNAFDADVVIYAAAPGHPLGRRIASLFDDGLDATVSPGVGSVLLIPETLSRPRRAGMDGEVRAIAALLRRLDLVPVDEGLAELATVFGARYGLRAADAIHLATAVHAGADRFLTNNRRDFSRSIEEIDVVFPDDLPLASP